VTANWVQIKLAEEAAAQPGFWPGVGLSLVVQVKLIEHLGLEMIAGGGMALDVMNPVLPVGSTYQAPEVYTELGLRLTVALPMLSGGNSAPARPGATIASTPAVVVAQ
jgi:hypothetical protein